MKSRNIIGLIIGAVTILGLGQSRQLPEDQRKVIHLAGIFPISGVEGWQGGQACEPAVHT